MKTNLLTAAAMLLIAGTCLAQAPASEPVLQGPKVKDGGVPGVRRPFGDGQSTDLKQRLADRPLPQMEFMRALGALRDESTPENLRLTDEQQKQIRAINQQFEQSMRDFREQHKGEFEEMRGQFGDRGRPPRRPGGPDGAPGEPQAGKGQPGDGDQMMPPPPAGEGKPDGAARQKFEELRAQAPSPKDAQAKIFAVLTDAQKPLVQERLESIKKDMAERALSPKAHEEVRRRLAKQNGEGGLRQFNPDNLPPKLKERFESMTPEEREQAIARFRERAQNRGPRPEGGPQGGPQGGPGGPNQKRPGPDALPEDLRQQWESMTPEERKFLMDKLRERAAENGERIPGDRPPPPRKPKPPENGNDAPPPPPGN
ncbi:MAG: hypothetical protein U0573_03325 [Phycisphaerales bacterium]|nr:hypothetical protein [Planctomycetota bacterium]